MGSAGLVLLGTGDFWLVDVRRGLLAPGVGDGQPAVTAEVLRRDLRPGWVLPPLVLRSVDQPDDPFDELAVIAGPDELVAAQVALDVVVEKPVEDVVRRQPVLIELAGRELRGRRLVDDLLRGRAAPSPPPR